MTITYVYHDCFLIETEHCCLLFDFWQRPDGMPAPVGGFAGTSPIASSLSNKPLYVFVSHFHKDHYNPEIFLWEQLFSKVHYIISKDTARHARHILLSDSLYKGYHPRPESVTILRKGEKWSDDLITAYAFGSTDVGNSYVVQVDGKTIFHAGDLNAWLWLDDSTQAEVAKARGDFRAELTPIVKAFPHIDVAMFPVDARIGSGFQEGAEIMLGAIEVTDFFPMHFTLCENENECISFKQGATDFSAYAPERTRCHGLTNPGDSITL